MGKPAPRFEPPRKRVIPGDSANSLLMKRITGGGGLARMPLGSPALSAAKIAVIGKWIDAGAVLPTPQRHWAFIPPVRSAPPATSRPAWVRNPIDAFLLARLDREGIQPSPEAGRPALLRRLTLDLTGLRRPPPRNSMPSWPTAVPTPMRRRLTACWPRPITASDGRASGWTRPAMPTPTATKRTPRVWCGFTAIG